MQPSGISHCLSGTCASLVLMRRRTGRFEMRRALHDAPQDTPERWKVSLKAINSP